MQCNVVCGGCQSINRVPAERLADGAKCGQCKQLLLDGQAIAATGQSLSRHIQKDELPVLVDFWAPWCGPCKMMAPVFEQQADAFRYQVRFTKLNTEQHPQPAQQFGIRGIPTMILFNNGKEVDRLTGATDGDGLSNWLQQNLNSQSN